MVNRELLNVNQVRDQFKSRDRSTPVRIHSSILNLDEIIQPSNFDELRLDLMNIAKRFPHRRVALTCRTSKEEFILDLHPVTGAA